MTFWRAFRSARPAPIDDGWWRDADRAVESPTEAALVTLAAVPLPSDPDEAERREEMLDGLHQLMTVHGAPLPVVPTQHRVIGTDTCHFVAPVSRAGEPAAGKLFLTSRRMVVVGSAVAAWPWHRIRRIDREGRDLVVAATEAAVVLQCNIYGDALVALYIAKQLTHARAGLHP